MRIHQGLVASLVEDGVFKSFGISYAAPPVGELRWRLSEVASSWEGIRDAKAFSPICHQVVGYTLPLRQTHQDEDYLYINIWTQSLDLMVKRPVLLWIFGAGNVGGAGSEQNGDGSHLAARGAVIVTFSYRLGAYNIVKCTHSTTDKLEASLHDQCW